MTDRLRGKTAFITGAASGIGRASALLFAAEGARIAACDINAAGGEDVAQAIRQGGGSIITMSAAGCAWAPASSTR